MENTFTIMPMSQQISLTPGKTYTGTITIVNPVDATEDFHYKIEISPYGVVGEGYQADLQTTTGRNEITKWIKIDEPTGAIKPNESKKVTFTIETPNNAAAGGQYAALTVSSNSNISSGNGVSVNNIFEMASLIYANVTGDVERGGEVLENNIPGFVAVPPLETSVVFENTGNIHEVGTVVLKVTNFFTGEVIFPTGEETGEFSEIVMPESTYRATRNISNLPALGVVKVSQTVYYRGNEAVVNEKEVILCPIWFLLLVVACIAAIVAFIISRVRKHRKKRLDD